MGWLCHRFLAREGVRIWWKCESVAQVQILWEVSNQCGESLMVPVLGMRGGFSLDLDLEDEDGSGEVPLLSYHLS